METVPLDQDKTSKTALQSSIVFGAAQILIILFFWRRLPPQLPLFYSRPWGKEQLTTPLGLLILPGFSLVIFLINLAIGSVIPKEEILVRQVLLIASSLFNFFCLIALIQILRLVI